MSRLVGVHLLHQTVGPTAAKVQRKERERERERERRGEKEKEKERREKVEL
jgi:hypothetical protein